MSFGRVTKTFNSLNCNPSQWHEILSVKFINRVGDKAQTWWRPTFTRNKSDLFLKT